MRIEKFVCNLFPFHRGTVIKMGVPRMLQTQRLFRCGQCGEIFTVTADYEQYYRLDRPAACPNFRDPERRCRVRESTGELPKKCGRDDCWIACAPRPNY